MRKLEKYLSILCGIVALAGLVIIYYRGVFILEGADIGVIALLLALSWFSFRMYKHGDNWFGFGW